MRRHTRWLLITLVMSILVIGAALAAAVMVSCGWAVDRAAISFAKEDLYAQAQTAHVEVTEIEVAIPEEVALTPADRANGIQARATIILSYAWRCPGQFWVDDNVFYRLRRTGGSWEFDPGTERPEPDFSAAGFRCGS